MVDSITKKSEEPAGRDELVEIASRALFDAQAYGPPEDLPTFDTASTFLLQHLAMQATAALAAIEQAGYVVLAPDDCKRIRVLADWMLTAHPNEADEICTRLAALVGPHGEG